MKVEENLLIARAQEGEQDALNELVTAYWPTVYRLALSKTGSSDDAKEIAQDTFLRALSALPRYQQTNAAFMTYLARITLNLVIDYYRKRGRSPHMIDIGQYAEPLIDTGICPETAVISAEQQREVARLLALLPEEQQRVVELRIMQGVAVADVARILGKSGAAVKMLQQRALKKLKILFEENGIAGGGGLDAG